MWLYPKTSESYVINKVAFRRMREILRSLLASVKRLRLKTYSRFYTHRSLAWLFHQLQEEGLLSLCDLFLWKKKTPFSTEVCKMHCVSIHSEVLNWQTFMNQLFYCFELQCIRKFPFAPFEISLARLSVSLAQLLLYIIFKTFKTFW